MKRYFLIPLIGTLLHSAVISQGSSIKVEARYFQKDRCLVISLEGRVIGERKDSKAGDEVEFVVYDDGKVIASKKVAVPVAQAIDLHEFIRYEGNLSSRSPGVALESEELGVYIDPLVPVVVDDYCSDYLQKESIIKELNATCNALSKFGFSCESEE